MNLNYSGPLTPTQNLANINFDSSVVDYQDNVIYNTSYAIYLIMTYKLLLNCGINHNADNVDNIHDIVQTYSPYSNPYSSP